MTDRTLDDQSGEEGSDTDALLRELIPDEALAEVSGTGVETVATEVPATVAPEAAAIGGSNDERLRRLEHAGVIQIGPRGESGDHAAPVVAGRRSRRPLLWIVGALVALGLLGLVFQVGFSAGSDSANERNNQTESADATNGAGETAAATVDSADEGATAEAGESGLTDGDDTPAPPTTDAEAIAPGSGAGTSLKLTLDHYMFTIDGVVPTEEDKAAIEQRMGLVFADFGTSNILVDPSAEPTPWLGGAPSLVNTMVLLHDGTIEVNDEGVSVSGRALASDFDKLAGALSADNGFPDMTIDEQEIVDKEAPMVRAVANGDSVTLTGELADEMMQATIVDGAKAIYGDDNVIDQTTVNPERHNRFLIMRFPSNLAAYRVFGNFDIRGENESFTAVLESGLAFDVAESELTDESRERLAGVMFTLTRNPLPVTITGHTDAIGRDSDNQALSESRAKSVAAFLQENGVLPENIVQIVGKGESEPVADNGTDEGRARNRRVEIVVGLYNE